MYQIPRPPDTLNAKGLVTLDVEYIDGTKIESKANKYTFVWRKTVERNRARLMEKIKALLSQVDDAIAQDKAVTDEAVSCQWRYKKAVFGGILA